jgi:hypothetical protein
MRRLLDDYTLDELLDVVDADEVITLMKKDKFYATLPEFNSGLDSDEIIEALKDSGFGHDISCFIVDNFDSCFDLEVAEDNYLDYLRNYR